MCACVGVYPDGTRVNKSVDLDVASLPFPRISSVTAAGIAPRSIYSCLVPCLVTAVIDHRIYIHGRNHKTEQHLQRARECLALVLIPLLTFS